MHITIDHRGMDVCVCFWVRSMQRIASNEWCFRPRFCTVRFYKAGDNLGYWDEFWCESCPRCRIDYSTFWSAVQHATIVLRLPLPMMMTTTMTMMISYDIVAYVLTNGLIYIYFSPRRSKNIQITPTLLHFQVIISPHPTPVNPLCWGNNNLLSHVLWLGTL